MWATSRAAGVAHMEVEYIHTFIVESSLGGWVASTCVISVWQKIAQVFQSYSLGKNIRSKFFFNILNNMHSIINPEHSQRYSNLTSI